MEKRKCVSAIECETVQGPYNPNRHVQSGDMECKSGRQHRTEVFEMKCLKAIRGVTLYDRVRNEDIREQLGEGSNITDTIRE